MKKSKKSISSKGNLGRKSKYDTCVLPRMDEIKFLCTNGAIDKDIAAVLGISLSTLYKYKLEFPEFSEALACTKEVANARVQNALFINATNRMNLDAQKYWLKNRMPGEWRDKQEMEISAQPSFEINVKILDTDAPEPQEKEPVVAGKDKF